MTKKITELLNHIEREHGVEIFYACESGSRAWGFASPNSDYDIRFIYRRPHDKYLSIFESASTIEIPIHDDLDPGGWDMHKALNLLGKSNGALIEWLHSPIVYRDVNGFAESWRSLAKSVFQPEKNLHHYLGHAHQTYGKQSALDRPTGKSYLYILRTLLAAKWVQVHESPAPVPFEELRVLANDEINAAIDTLIQWKTSAQETDTLDRIPVIDTFVDEALASKNTWKPSATPSTDFIKNALDQEFRNQLRKDHQILSPSDFTLSKIREPQYLLLEAISGSHAYGTQTPDSDLDLKGVFVAPDSFHAGMEEVTQVADEKNDEVYYELSRFFQLLAKNNPTALELLCTPDDCIRSKHPAFELINPEIFISKLCEKSFSGYAEMQIKKARGLNKKIVNPQPKERKHLRDFCFVLENQGSVPLTEWLTRENLSEKDCGLVSVNHAPNTYALFHSTKITFRGLFSPKDDAALICSSVPLESEPIAWINCNLDAFKAHCREHHDYWQWVENRNENRYATNQAHGRDYDSKNMMHTLRLLDTAYEIAKEGTIRVRRPNAEWLLRIRNGELSYDEIMDLTETKISNIKEAYKNTSLPDEPNRALIKERLREVQLAFQNSQK